MVEQDISHELLSGSLNLPSAPPLRDALGQEELPSADSPFTEVSTMAKKVSEDQAGSVTVGGDSNVLKNPILLHEELNNEILGDYPFSSSIFSDFSDCDDNEWKPVLETLSSPVEPYIEVSSPLSFWNTCPLDLESMKIDEVFQVEKDDLVQSPTLAELNASDESLFDSFDDFDVILKSEEKSLIEKSKKTNEFCQNSVLSNIVPQNLSGEPPIIDKVSEGPQSGVSSGESTVLILKSKSSLETATLQTVPTSSACCPDIQMTTSDLYIITESSTTSTLETLDSVRDLHKDYATVQAKKCDDLAQSSDVIDIETDDEESEMECDSSEVESDEDKKLLSTPVEDKMCRFFWQYNVQAKGPKGPRLPEVAHAFCPGKSRRGDGNDLTPNPTKLYHIGLELEKLNCAIDDLTPVSELPFSARIRSRKEKNKLASRACRLKKKAQHEANKLKLFGLQQEQKHLQSVVSESKKMLLKRIQAGLKDECPSLEAAIKSLSMTKDVPKVAGLSADYVNNALRNVGYGDDSGGLEIIFKE